MEKKENKTIIEIIQSSKFKTLYLRNFVFSISVFVVVILTAISFRDWLLNVIGAIIFLYLLFINYDIYMIEKNGSYKEEKGTIIGYEKKAKASVLTPKKISEECGFVIETEKQNVLEITIPRFELKLRCIMNQEGMNPEELIGRDIVFYYNKNMTKPFHYDIAKERQDD